MEVKSKQAREETGGVPPVSFAFCEGERYFR